MTEQINPPHPSNYQRISTEACRSLKPQINILLDTTKYKQGHNNNNNNIKNNNSKKNINNSILKKYQLIFINHNKTQYEQLQN